MDLIKERDAALLREKTARQQFETSFRTAVDNVILPAAAPSRRFGFGPRLDDRTDIYVVATLGSE